MTISYILLTILFIFLIVTGIIGYINILTEGVVNKRNTNNWLQIITIVVGICGIIFIN